MRVKTKPRSMTDSKSLRKKARLVLSLSTSSRSWWWEKVQFWHVKLQSEVTKWTFSFENLTWTTLRLLLLTFVIPQLLSCDHCSPSGNETRCLLRWCWPGLWCHPWSVLGSGSFLATLSAQRSTGGGWCSSPAVCWSVGTKHRRLRRYIIHSERAGAGAGVLFRWKRSYHELKEEPGLLKGALPDTPAAHHPLERQLLVEELRDGQRGGEERTAARRRKREASWQESLSHDSNTDLKHGMKLECVLVCDMSPQTNEAGGRSQNTKSKQWVID